MKEDYFHLDHMDPNEEPNTYKLAMRFRRYPRTMCLLFALSVYLNIAFIIGILVF